MANRTYNDHTLKELIRQMLEKNGLEKKYDQIEVIQAFRDLVGPVVSRHTTEAFMREKCLVLKLDSAALRQELSMNKTRLIQLINDQFAQTMVNEMEFR